MRVAGNLNARLTLMRLEELHRVTGGVLEQDLIAADAVQDLAAEGGPGRLEPLDLAGEVRDLELEAVPTTGLGPAAIGQGLPSPALPARRAQQQAQRAAREHRELRRGVHVDREPKAV